ncbi:DUF4405 domain-containing protein [Anaerosacchariphilus polymeriproducens]|uniref:DUF4405 domain-containing protein n=1 Tax=Anaerosacchariphilus polymeriproducens TaxID=1812858 RepID=A0A371ART5_9FIRM|nr:DUF4405 domain-containing protein [Anaerosacchariphilus polymeriproducens]RDU22264.1 DUF4405 domain-containing protein [Anaerosacchariphilus polymeriproducens]
MAKNKVLKIAIDIVMTVLMIFLMGYSATGNFVHEVLGITIFVLFVFHCILNYKWFKQLPAQLKRISFFSVQMVWIIVNLLLVIDIIALMISSLFMSREILNFIQITDKAPWIFMHKITAYTAFILISIHLGLHWNMIMQMGRKVFAVKDKNKIRTMLLRVIALLMAVLGVKSSFDRGIALKYIPSTMAAANMKGDKNTGKSKKQSGKKDEKRTFTETVKEGESKDEFLGRLICTGCGKQCTLLEPQCGKGRRQEKQAVEYYKTQVLGTEDTTLNHDVSSETEEGLKDYLGGLYCDGCGKHCSLLTPQCGIGQEKVQEISKEYKEKVSAGIAVDEKDDITIKVDRDSFVKVFGDYIPIMGLYIAGTYYTFKLIKRKDKKKQEESIV